MTFDTEQRFPIYQFKATWIQDGVHDDKYPNWHKGLPEGRVWDSVSFRKMYREEPNLREVQLYLIDWWDTYKLKKQERIKNPSIPLLSVELYEWETWCLNWFQHYTFDTGQNDLEVLASFERFIERKQRLNMESQAKDKTDVYCLMGAEDRWRWHGAEPDGEGDTRSPAPCRCKFCKEQGVIRIGH